MPLTSRTSDATKVVPARIRAIIVNDTTGTDAGAITISLLSEGEYRVEPVVYETTLGRRQIAERHIIRFQIPDLLSPQTGTFVNELVTRIIPRVKIRLLDGTEITIDSGTNSEPAFHFTKTLTRNNEVLVWEIEGERYKSVEPML
ncbi:MAG: hypothetical protein ABDI07_11560 [Candidatus Kryptonium sp.]